MCFIKDITRARNLKTPYHSKYKKNVFHAVICSGGNFLGTSYYTTFLLIEIHWLIAFIGIIKWVGILKSMSVPYIPRGTRIYDVVSSRGRFQVLFCAIYFRDIVFINVMYQRGWKYFRRRSRNHRFSRVIHQFIFFLIISLTLP